MSKAKKESVADVLARKKANKKTKEAKKPAKKKAGVNDTKKRKKQTPILSNNKQRKKKLKSKVDNLKNGEIYLDFIDFIASPTHLKKYESQKEFAKEIGIGEDTLSDWKKRDGFWDDVRSVRKSMIRDKMLPKVLTALYTNAIRRGEAKEAKLMFQLGDEFVEKREDNSKITVEELTPAKKAKIKQRINNWDSVLSEKDDDEEEE
jgi:hypothetical protein